MVQWNSNWMHRIIGTWQWRELKLKWSTQHTYIMSKKNVNWIGLRCKTFEGMGTMSLQFICWWRIQEIQCGNWRGFGEIGRAVLEEESNSFHTIGLKNNNRGHTTWKSTKCDGLLTVISCMSWSPSPHFSFLFFSLSPKSRQFPLWISLTLYQQINGRNIVPNRSNVLHRDPM